MENSFEDAFQVLEDIGIPESQYFQSLIFQIILPYLVGIFLTEVCLAIEFDDEGSHGTIEVGDVRLNDVLTPESEPTESPATKLRPKDFLGRTLITT